MSRRARDEEILALHRELVAIPSLSHEEDALVAFVLDHLASAGVEVERLGDNVVASAGSGRELLFNTHLDTVRPGDRWTRDPWTPERVDGKVFGLGSNDAKAAVAAMIGALLEVRDRDGPCRLTLTLVCEEETGGKGTELVWPALRERGLAPGGVVVGEPTSLDIAIAQKGMLVLELIATGQACHSANASSLGARNAVRELARDLIALEAVELGERHPTLGATTLEPTITQGGSARNMVPDRASSFLDVRTVPGLSHDQIIERIAASVSGDVRVVSKRLQPCSCDESEPVVVAARQARPEARIYGSRTMSDLVYFGSEVAAIKCGPGDTGRSHTPDEFVFEREILDGAEFYVGLAHAFAAAAR